MRVLITGITGQDGRYLTSLLKSLDYDVHGFTRKPLEEIDSEILSDLQEAQLYTVNLVNYDQVKSNIKAIQPELIFNLAGLSSVRDSFLSLQSTFEANFFAVETILKAILDSGLRNKTRIYQASSSEMFGATSQSPQSEDSNFNPISPYGLSKLSAHHLCLQYREREGMFISSGILYNHESPKRSVTFVSRKITQEVAKISLGKSNQLVLGNLEASRDWGHAGDYVNAMLKILKYPEPDDFVVSTGVAHSVFDFVKESFKAAGMEGAETEFLKTSDQLYRKHDHSNLVGNSEKARTELQWVPEVTFKMLVNEMIVNDIEKIRG